MTLGPFIHVESTAAINANRSSTVLSSVGPDLLSVQSVVGVTGPVNARQRMLIYAALTVRGPRSTRISLWVMLQALLSVLYI